MNRCFIPDDAIQELRTYQRLREDHIRSASMRINHMQKALTRMNIRLKEVISQIHGASGMKIIKAIISGERDPEKLASLCHTAILKHKKQEVIKSLKGYYSQDQLFALVQALEAYEFYQSKIADYDQKLEQCLKRLSNNNEASNKNSKTKKLKRKPIRHHKPDI